MKKIILKIFFILTIFFWSCSFSNAWNITFEDASDATSKISSVSIDKKSWSVETQVQNITYNIFKTVKIIIGWLFVIYIVYTWTMMIMSMWDDEKRLSSAKKNLRYAIVWLLFINIPWLLYNSFTNKMTTDDVTSALWDTRTIFDRNIFMNSDVFWNTLASIITFLEITIVVISVFMIVLTWIKMILSAWEEKAMTEWKQKILWSLAWLVFIWIMEAWRNIVFIWDFKKDWQDLFATLVNLALFFAWPIAIFFISLAWYYYITSGWDEEKVKKAKSIIINTVIATLILLWMYTVLLDLKTLNF